MKKLLLLTLLCIPMTGCVGYGAITKNLSENGSIVSIPTPWGRAYRIGETTNSVRISADGQIFINEVQK